MGEIANEVIAGDRSQETGEIIETDERRRAAKKAENYRRAGRRKKARARKKERQS